MKQYKNKKTKKIYTLESKGTGAGENGSIYYSMKVDERTWVYGEKAFKETFEEVKDV